MKLSAKGGQAKPVAANATGFNPWKFTKLQKMVVVARTVGRNVDEPSYIHSVIEFDLHGDLYDAVKADYELVRNTLCDPCKGFNALTGKMGYYIQPRTKGAGHGSTSRAFYARPRFLAKFIKLKS